MTAKKRATRIPRRGRSAPVDTNLAIASTIATIALVLLFALFAKTIFGPSTSLATRSHELGELVVVDRTYSVAVTKATFDNSIGPKLHLPPTMRVIVLDVQVQNLTKQRALNYLPIIHTFMRDDQGNTYDFKPGLSDQVMSAKLILPGETLKGKLAYIIPSSYRPLWFYFDAKFDEQGPVSFRVVK